MILHILLIMKIMNIFGIFVTKIVYHVMKKEMKMIINVYHVKIILS